MSHAWLRSTFALLLSLGLSAPGLAAEDDGKGKGPAEGRAGAAKGPRDGQGFPNREAMLKRFDKNGDGRLDDAEKTAARSELGPRGGKPGEGGMNPERKAEFMKRFDKNNDGQIDETEKAAARAEFEKMRGARGGEGKPGEGKLGAGKPGEGRGVELMKRFDKNGDGRLDDAERAAAKAEMGNRGTGGDKPGLRPNGGDQPGAKKPEKN